MVRNYLKADRLSRNPKFIFGVEISDHELQNIFAWCQGTTQPDRATERPFKGVVRRLGFIGTWSAIENLTSIMKKQGSDLQVGLKGATGRVGVISNASVLHDLTRSKTTRGRVCQRIIASLGNSRIRGYLRRRRSRNI